MFKIKHKQLFHLFFIVFVVLGVLFSSKPTHASAKEFGVYCLSGTASVVTRTSSGGAVPGSSTTTTLKCSNGSPPQIQSGSPRALINLEVLVVNVNCAEGEPSFAGQNVRCNGGVGSYSMTEVRRIAADPDAQPNNDLISSSSGLEGDCKNADLSQDCVIVDYLILFINVLSGIVGVVIVIMITIGGIQYSTARDNPQAAAAAKGRITNAVMALVFYLFIFAFLQYIVPGGVL